MKRHPGMFQKGYDPRRFDLTAICKARKGTHLSKEQCRRMSEGEQDKEKRQMYRDYGMAHDEHSRAGTSRKRKQRRQGQYLVHNNELRI